MIITKLSPDDFGKFHDMELELKPGINVIYGQNESGKSTMHSFIKCMLFGAPRSRGRGAVKGDYALFEPKEGGGFSGRMTFEYKGRTYRINRNFSKENTSYSLTDLDTLEEIQRTGDDISEFIPLLTAQNYSNTISIGQMEAAPSPSFAGDMQTMLANMAMSGDKTISVIDAQNRLKKLKRQIEREIPDAEIRDINDRISVLRRETVGIEEIRSRAAAAEQEKAKLTREIDSLRARGDKVRSYEQQDRVRAAMLIQENNDIARQYSEKKKELMDIRESMEKTSATAMPDAEKKADAYYGREDKLREIEERTAVLKDMAQGAVLRAFAIALPVFAVAIIVYLFGTQFGLSEDLREYGALAIVAFSGLLLIILLIAAAGRKKKIRKLEHKGAKLEAQQKEFLKRNGIGSDDDPAVMFGTRSAARENILRIESELKTLKKRYDDLQVSLAPYIEKYGDTISIDAEPDADIQTDIEQLQKRRQEITREGEQLAWQLEMMTDKKNDIAKYEAELSELYAKRKEAYDKITAVSVGMDAIRESTAVIHGSFGRELNSRVSELFSRITDGSHGRLSVDENFRIKADDGKFFLYPENLSAGTVDQMYFAVRVSLCEMMYKEEMPLIFDDSFALYDDRRLWNTLFWLSRQDFYSQVIIFTCHRREEEALESIGVPFNYVEL
ncbi:MAG: AAA family ATPase [Lachnospiraceae bacterium]|nr:AAA family ATPase [Lachnospiraceae bacterium]